MNNNIKIQHPNSRNKHAIEFGYTNIFTLKNGCINMIFKVSDKKKDYVYTGPDIRFEYEGKFEGLSYSHPIPRPLRMSSVRLLYFDISLKL